MLTGIKVKYLSLPQTHKRIHQVIAEDAYDVIQDAIDALEDLSEADGEYEEPDDDDDDNDDDDDDDDNNNNDNDYSNDKEDNQNANGDVKRKQDVERTNKSVQEGQTSAAGGSETPVKVENPTTTPKLQQFPESEPLQEQSAGITEFQSHPNQQLTQPEPIVYAAISASSIVKVSESKLPAAGPPECCFFGLLKEPEWGLLWMMGLLCSVSLGVMTAMAFSEECGCGSMTCTE